MNRLSQKPCFNYHCKGHVKIAQKCFLSASNLLLKCYQNPNHPLPSFLSFNIGWQTSFNHNLETGLSPVLLSIFFRCKLDRYSSSCQDDSQPSKFEKVGIFFHLCIKLWSLGERLYKDYSIWRMLKGPDLNSSVLYVG